MFRVILVGALIAVLVVGIVLVSPHSGCTINVVQSSDGPHQVELCR